LPKEKKSKSSVNVENGNEIKKIKKTKKKTSIVPKENGIKRFLVNRDQENNPSAGNFADDLRSKKQQKKSSELKSPNSTNELKELPECDAPNEGFEADVQEPTVVEDPKTLEANDDEDVSLSALFPRDSTAAQ